MFARELTIIGVRINPFSFTKSIGLIEAMGTRYISYEKLGIKTFALKDYEEAIKELKGGKIAKAMFDLSKWVRSSYRIILIPYDIFDMLNKEILY